MHIQKPRPGEGISRVHPFPEFKTAVHRGFEQTIKSMPISAAAWEQLESNSTLFEEVL